MSRTTTIYAAAAALTLAACAGEPPLDPGRPRPALRYSEADLFLLAEELHADLLKRETAVSEGEDLARLRRVGGKLSKATYHDHYAWSFTLLARAKTARAVCLPGGRVLVDAGLFKHVGTDADLAAALAPALAHATLRHPNERLSAGKQPPLAAPVAAGAWAKAPPAARALIESAFGLSGRADPALEREADDVGLAYLERAGYPLEAAAAFWKRLDAPRGARLAKRARALQGLPPVKKTKAKAAKTKTPGRKPR